jgi:hypothetical protein
VRIIERRLRQLEDRFGPGDGKPRRRLRLMVSMAGSRPSLEGATCIRRRCPEGTLLELVEFNEHNEGSDELTDEELDTWVETFPAARKPC